MKRNQKEQRSDPDLTDVLENLKEDIYKNINSVQVGNIEAFNAAKQTVSVQIAIKQVIDEDDNGVKRYQNLPLLIECPIVILSGGSAHITIPPQVGDGCLLLFNDRDIENWFLDGGIKAPNGLRKHDLSDAFAVVGVRNMQTVIDDFLTDGVRLQWDSSSKIEIKSGTIESTTAIFKQDGIMQVTQGLVVGGTVTQLTGGAPLVFDADVEQTSGKVLKAGNGVSGTFIQHTGGIVTVADGIIVSIT